MRNLEIKVAYPDGHGECRSILRRLTGPRFDVNLSQIDTYFHLPNGRRLKLRQIVVPEPESSQLIAYHRPDLLGTRTSDYVICDVQRPDEMLAVLAHALGPAWVVVKKDRELWTWEHTCIHLDTVESLGVFVELETVMGGQNEDNYYREHDIIKAALKLDDLDQISCSYSDLVKRGA